MCSAQCYSLIIVFRTIIAVFITYSSSGQTKWKQHTQKQTENTPGNFVSYFRFWLSKMQNYWNYAHDSECVFPQVGLVDRINKENASPSAGQTSHIFVSLFLQQTRLAGYHLVS